MLTILLLSARVCACVCMINVVRLYQSILYYHRHHYLMGCAASVPSASEPISIRSSPIYPSANTTTAMSTVADAAAILKPVASTAAPGMEYRNLGRSGLKVSVLALGAMVFSTASVGIYGVPTADKASSEAILDAYVAAGGNFIDTAPQYGESESIIGNWLARRVAADPNFRKSIVIGTKFRLGGGTGVNDTGASRHVIMNQIDTSLKALKTDYIDVYIQHAWDASTPPEETLRALNDLVRVGKVRYLGLSNFPSYGIQQSSDVAKREHLSSFTSGQYQYSLLSRNIEWELSDVCAGEGVGITCWAPLSSGWLSGKHDRTNDAAIIGSRIAWASKVGFARSSFDTNNNERTYVIIDALKAIASELNTSVASVALRWCIQRDGISSVIFGTRNIEQLNDNMRAATIRLTSSHMSTLNDASDVPPPYPYDMVRQFNVKK